jgi:hypothetical protein
MRNSLKKIGLISLVLIFSTTGLYAQPINVGFAGITFTGDFKDQRNALSEYGNSLLTEHERLKNYNKMLSEIASIKNANYNVTMANLDSSSGEAYILAVGIDYEQLEIREIPQKEEIINSVVTRVYAQIMVFDFINKKLIKSYPVILSIKDVIEGVVSKDKTSALFNEIYTKELPQKLQSFLQNQEAAFQRPAFSLKLRGLNLGKHAIKALDKHGVDADVFKNKTASMFAANIATVHEVPIIPFSKGRAIGKMSLRLANNDAQSFQLPEGDYLLDIEIIGLKEKVLKETELEIGVTYISAAKLTLYDTFKNNKVIFNVRLQSGVPVIYPKEIYAKLEIWEELDKSLIFLAQDFSTSLKNTEIDYLKKVVKGENSTKEKQAQFAKMNTIMRNLK